MPLALVALVLGISLAAGSTAPDAGTSSARTERRADAGTPGEDDKVAADLDLLENLELLKRLDVLDESDSKSSATEHSP